MKSLLAGSLGAAVLFSIYAPSTQADTPKPNYRLSATWKLPGDGGWDYLNLDSKKHRLYIARSNRIQVVDSNSGELVGEVRGLNGAHGVALDPNSTLAYATSGRSNSVIVFDTESLKQVGDPIPVGENPDAILFEPTGKKIWAFDADSNAVSIIDPEAKKVTQLVPLGGNPEFGIADGKGHVWVNIENTSELVELNTADGKVLGRTSLAPGDGPTGLAYDPAGQLLFSGCANRTMTVVNAKDGKVVTTLPIGDGVDAAAFDSKRKLAFSSNGRDGTLSVVGFTGKEPALLNTVATHVGARTMTLDKETGAIYVVAADYEAPQPAAPGQRPGRPKMMPGSAVVMKLEPDTPAK